MNVLIEDCYRKMKCIGLLELLLFETELPPEDDPLNVVLLVLFADAAVP